MPEFTYTQSKIHPAWSALRSKGCPDGDLLPSDDPHFKFMAKLPAFLRTLLITDGTVTKSLESYFWEPILIEHITLTKQEALYAIPWLNVAIGEQLLIRHVQLVGRKSNCVYTTAYSIIRLNQIPSSMRISLEQGGIGIGVLIRQLGVESYREILDIGHTPTLAFDDSEAQSGKDTDFVYRSYRIMVNQQPTILITEKFPKLVYQ